MRGRLLTLLYVSREKCEKCSDVNTGSFIPPWTMRDIRYYGDELYQDRLLESCPTQHSEDGFFMSLSIRGENVWLGRETSSLEISGLPE